MNSITPEQNPEYLKRSRSPSFSPQSPNPEQNPEYLKISKNPSNDSLNPPLDPSYNQKFQSKQGPGSVKSIWILKDWEDQILSKDIQVLPKQVDSQWFQAANGSQWRLTISKSPEKTHLSIFLEASPQFTIFPQDAEHTITIQILKPNGKLERLLNKTSKDTFTLENSMIGYPKSLPLSKLASLNDRNLLITSVVKTSANKEICKKITGFVGLVNEGTTCYMNSLLQTLFLITAFRKAIYSIPFSDSEEFRVPKALGKLFAALQTSEKPLSTQDLLRSFGWARDKWHEQQDVQEFSYKFSDTLEKSMIGTQAEGTYSQLFKGLIVQKIQCINVNYLSESVEEFIDLQLDVKGCGNIIASLDKYVEPVVLKGEIQYDAEGFGKQDAIKVVKFKKLPSVLQIQLKRFEYNQNRGMMTKVNEKFEFYSEIDLNKYSEEEGTENRYKLFSVTVHSGTLGKGHYSSFISPGLNGKWFKFNDDKVDLALASQAIESNWGGEVEDITLGEGGKIVFGKKKCDISAYMLVYIRITDRSMVLPPVTEASIPSQLLVNEKTVEYIRRDNKRNCRYSFILGFATKESVISWDGPGLTNGKCKGIYFIRIAKVQETLGSFFRNKLPVFNECKLWTFVPGPSNWMFQEANLNDPLSNWAFTEELTRCIFIECPYKIINGNTDNWAWNDLETLSYSEKHDFTKAIVFIKKYEKETTKIVGCEWLSDNLVKDLHDYLFKKYFENQPEGWVCLETSNSHSPIIKEIYQFQLNAKSTLNCLKSSDCLIIGLDLVDAPKKVLEVYNQVQIEAIYSDRESFYDQKSYSKELLEKYSFNTQVRFSIDLSCTLLELMKAVYLNINLPIIPEKSIQVLTAALEPAKAQQFSLSKVLSHFKVYFDIISFNALEDHLVHFTVLEFSNSFDLVRSFLCEAKDNLLKALRKMVPEDYQIFLFRYQQRAVLKFLQSDETIHYLPGGVFFAIQPQKIEKNANRLQVIGFHGFSVEQGTGKPFFFSFKKNVSCEDLKRKISERTCCLPDSVKVVKVDSEVLPSCFKLVGDLEESDEEFGKKYCGCGIFIEHRSQGMKFN